MNMMIKRTKCIICCFLIISSFIDGVFSHWNDSVRGYKFIFKLSSPPSSISYKLYNHKPTFLITQSSILNTRQECPLFIRGGGGGSDISQVEELCKSYGIPMSKLSEDRTNITILGGSLTDALQVARSQARLLVVFIPGSKPSKGKSKYDKTAIESLLSEEVASVVEKKAIKKENLGSFLVWSARYGSSEATNAMKRLKCMKGGGKKNPTLLVAYPSQGIDSMGRVKVTPRLLAQHHCNPPPSPQSMAAWLNTLRKRHVKQYAAMQHDLRELSLLKERTQGYQSSIQDDRKREEEEELKEKRRLEKEREKKEKEEAIEQRRKELRDSMLDEPDLDEEGVMTIALRFGDGKTGKRRFSGDESLEHVFNWIDCMFEINRENLVLTSMSGQKSFTYEDAKDLILGETGLGKMVALRVTQTKDANTDTEIDE